MRKNTFRLAALLALAAVFLCSTALAAAEDADTGYSDAALQAAPTISAEGAVEQGGLLSITVSLGTGGTAAKAAIQTSGLQYLRTDGAYATQNNVALLASAPTAVYHYKVTAAPSQIVEFRLTDVAVVAGASETEEEAPGTYWTARVTGTGTGPAPSASPSQTQPPAASSVPQPSKPTEPVVISGDAAIAVSGTIASGQTIQATLSTQADGLQGTVKVAGLEFVSVDNRFCSSEDLILVNSGTGASARAVYTYVVTAAAGETVSIDVSNVTISRNGADVAGSSSAWITWAAASGSTPGGTSPGGSLGAAAGLSFVHTASGQKVLTGLRANRYGMRAAEFRRYITVPAGCTLLLSGPNGRELDDRDLICTGSRILAVKADGSLQDSALVSLLGDVRGTGTVSVIQLVQVAGYLNGTRFPSELEVLSCDFNKDGIVGITDLVSEAGLLH